MSSTNAMIANAMQGIVAAVPNAPSLVEVRKTDVLHPTEAKNAVFIVPVGGRKAGQTTGDDGADGGTAIKAYRYWVTVYQETQGDVSTGVDTIPAFVLACKQALDVNELPGAPTVYGAELVDDEAWERQKFRDGIEKSIFGLVYMATELRNG